MATTPQRARRGWLAALSAAAVLALSACGSGPAGAGNTGSDDAGSKDAGAADDSEALKVSLITHSAAGDTFWDIVRKGAEAAAARDNIELLYSAEPDGARQAQLVEQAIDQGVDGIVVTLAKPEAMSTAVTAALDAGIPVYSVNSGEDHFQELGVYAHFGQNEEVAGEAAGEQLNEIGASRAICVIHEQGNVGHEARCEGLSSTFEGDSEVLYVQGADMANVASTITSKLQTNSDIDMVVTLGAPFAMTAIDSIADAGSGAKLATFDLNAEAVEKLGSGELEFIVDQQPYLQGYAAVASVRLYLDNGNVLGGGKPVYTGPQILTSEDAETVATYAENGTR